jgi:hypothetical protein
MAELFSGAVLPFFYLGGLMSDTFAFAANRFTDETDATDSHQANHSLHTVKIRPIRLIRAAISSLWSGTKR